MKKSRSQNAVLNIALSLVLQLVTAVSGLFLPRLMIETYGSEVNGLIASITYFLSFISLLEAGAGGVIRASLYKPLAKGDDSGVSGIVRASGQFFRRIALVFVVYVFVLSFTYPLISTTKFDFFYVATMVLILSIGTLMQYYFGLPNYCLIVADQKARVVHIIDIITIIANFAISYFLVLQGVSIHIVKFVSCSVFAVKPLLYAAYVKKNYNIDKRAVPDKKAISQRWNGLVHHIAYFIHSNIDVVLLTVMVGTGYVSIYTVYYAVVSAVRKIVLSVSTGSAAGIGNLLASESQGKIRQVFDKFEFIQMSIITVIFSTTAAMLIPFIQIYTKNIDDYNYVYPVFGYLLVFAEAVYCIRSIYSTVSLAANKYKQTQLGAILEAAINLVVSIALISQFKLVGIAIGTACGMGCRMVFDMVYASRNVIMRSLLHCAKAFLCFLASGVACVTCCLLVMPDNFTRWYSWVLWGAIAFLVALCIQLVASLLCYRTQLKATFGTFKAKIFKN